jgi:hypothetical protein
MASIFDIARTAPKQPTTIAEFAAARQPYRGASPPATAPAAAPAPSYAAEDAEFAANFGKPSTAQAPPNTRPTSPNGLTYTDTGEKTPLYYGRQRELENAPGYENWQDPITGPTRTQIDSGEYKYDATSGTYYTMDRGLKKYISGNPAATGPQYDVPTFSVDENFRLSPGDGTVPGRQGTPEEAARGTAYFDATGNSTPPGGFGAPGSGAMGTGELGTLSQNAQAMFGGLAQARGQSAAGMLLHGQAAQGREAAQTGMVNYGKPQTVGTTNAQQVNYGPAQTVAAPTLASAKQAAMGSFGKEQSVNAQQVGPAAQATAQQASATSAANQAGFLANTAAGARGISDLDMGQSNQSRDMMGAGIDRLNAFVDQGPGESQAQAQLRMAQEQNLGDALSLARSGRGNAAGNMKMAISENAATNAQTNQQAALLRANEADLWRGRQLQGLGIAQDAAGTMRGQDIGAATAAGQHAVSREQIASNVDVNRASLEQALSQFNAGAQNQASLTNAQLGTQVSMGNAEQSNLGSRLNAQLGTDAAIQQASLANARNVAMGQTGSQVNMANAEQSNLTSRLQGQLQSDAERTRAELANQLGIAQGNSTTDLRGINANNASAAERTRAELAGELAVASGNSQTDLTRANLEAKIRQQEANDKLMSDMYGYGVDLGGQEINANKYGADSAFNYADLAADIEGRNLDRQVGVDTANKDRKQKKQAAIIGGVSAAIETALPWISNLGKDDEDEDD